LEATLTLGLGSVISGTLRGRSRSARSPRSRSAYITVAGIWDSPIKGASTSPARTFGPDAVLGMFNHYWADSVGPLPGAAVTVGLAYVRQGPGADPKAAAAAQGTLEELVIRVRQQDAARTDEEGGAP